MTWLSEDPWPLAGLFAVIAVALLIALRVTQQGKLLVWAGVAFGLALAVIGIEAVWVTDRERIEAVVYDLADAVKQADYDRFESHLAPEFEIPGGIGGRAALRATLENYSFEMVRISQLEVDEPGRQTRMSTASFLATVSGRTTTTMGGPNFDAAITGWSLGFREAEPGVWQVTRADMTRGPRGLNPDAIFRAVGR